MVNHLDPYPSWTAFRPLIAMALDAHRRVIQPTGIHRIGLRYINRIVFPQPRVMLEDYFEVYPKLGPQLPSDHGTFIVGLQFAFADGRDALTLKLQTAAPEIDGERVVSLDIDYFLITPGAVSMDTVLEWIEAAHAQVEQVFEASITDVLRAQFGVIR